MENNDIQSTGNSQLTETKKAIYLVVVVYASTVLFVYPSNSLKTEDSSERFSAPLQFWIGESHLRLLLKYGGLPKILIKSITFDHSAAARV